LEPLLLCLRKLLALESAEGPLDDVKLCKHAGEKEELLSQLRKVKLQLEKEQQNSSPRGTVERLRLAVHQNAKRCC
jgi:hypothetical protein